MRARIAAISSAIGEEFAAAQPVPLHNAQYEPASLRAYPGDGHVPARLSAALRSARFASVSASRAARASFGSRASALSIPARSRTCSASAASASPCARARPTRFSPAFVCTINFGPRLRQRLGRSDVLVFRRARIFGRLRGNGRRRPTRAQRAPLVAAVATHRHARAADRCRPRWTPPGLPGTSRANSARASPRSRSRVSRSAAWRSASAESIQPNSANAPQMVLCCSSFLDSSSRSGIAGRTRIRPMPEMVARHPRPPISIAGKLQRSPVHFDLTSCLREEVEFDLRRQRFQNRPSDIAIPNRPSHSGDAILGGSD